MKMSQKGTPKVSVIICAHNEEKYVGKCLSSVLNALRDIGNEIIFVADRCTDNSVEIAKKYGVTKLIEKTWKKWENSYAESLQSGYLQASGEHISIIDADVVVPSDFFEKLIPMINDRIVSVSAQIVTFPHSFWNCVVYAWEKTYRFSPFGRNPRGAARVILKRALDEVNGFSDVPAPDTSLDLKLRQRGFMSVLSDNMRVWHIRDITLDKTVNGQLNAGRGRYILGVSFIRTVGHAIFRFRPFTICGWLMEWQTRQR